MAADAGYALTDALVALMLLAVSLVFSLTTLQQAREIGRVAGEYRRADLLLGQLMAETPRRLLAQDGVRDGFRWQVEMAATGAEQPIALCRRSVAVLSEATGRQFHLSTLETCPLAGAA